MSNINLQEKSSVAYLQQVLERAVIDLEFRAELLARPEEFGIKKEDVEVFKSLTSVEEQDMSFVELVSEPDISANCTSTCISGFTFLCDGGTFRAPGGGCRSTCVSGYTIRCDGTSL